MSSKDAIEKMEAGRTDGGVLVGRTLVHSYIKDPVRAAEVAEMARYAQLLTGRLRMPMGESQKVVLAAWLSALDEQRELIDPLIRQFSLQDILTPEDQLPGREGPNTGWLVLSLIAGYQELRRVEPGIEKDNEAVRSQLRDAWATTPARQTILNRFMLILRDEAFLHGLETPSAKVLIVDPAEVVSSELSLPLRGQGYDVRAAGNVPEAMKVLSAFRPDLILAEVGMPIEDGQALCAKIKADPATCGIPVILMTSSKSQRLVRECLKVGAEDVVVKPIDIELFFIKLRKLFAAKPAASAGPAGGVTGSLAEMALPDLVQILCGSQRNTRMELNQDGQQGVVYIRDGNVIEATSPGLAGEPAFYRMMTWKTGTFSAQPCTEFPERTIQAPVMSLLMEGARRNDEGIAPP